MGVTVTDHNFRRAPSVADLCAAVLQRLEAATLRLLVSPGDLEARQDALHAVELASQLRHREFVETQV